MMDAGPARSHPMRTPVQHMQSRITHETRSSTIPNRPASPLLLICFSRFVPASSHIPSVSFPYCADTPSKFQPRRGRPCRRADDGVHPLHKPHDSNNQHHPHSPCPTTFPWFPLHTMRITARNPNRGGTEDRSPGTIQTPQSRHTGAKRAETAIRQRSPRGPPLRYLLRSATCHVSLLQ